MYYVDEYKADRNRYETMQYNRCGKSGLKLPVVSLGLWHNFGSKDNYDMMKTLCFTARGSYNGRKTKCTAGTEEIFC